MIVNKCWEIFIPITFVRVCIPKQMDEVQDKRNLIQKIKSRPYTQRWFLFSASVIVWLVCVYLSTNEGEFSYRQLRNKGLLTLVFIALVSGVFFKRRKI